MCVFSLWSPYYFTKRFCYGYLYNWWDKYFLNFWHTSFKKQYLKRHSKSKQTYWLIKTPQIDTYVLRSLDILIRGRNLLQFLFNGLLHSHGQQLWQSLRTSTHVIQILRSWTNPFLNLFEWSKSCYKILSNAPFCRW